MSYLREPSDPRVRELNTALEKAREDAQYWHDLARIATEETDALKDRYDAQQQECDTWRARAAKVCSYCSCGSELWPQGSDAGRAVGDAVGRAEGAEQSLSLYEDRVERAEAKLLMETKRREDAEKQLEDLRKQLDDIQRSMVIIPPN